MRFSRRKRLVVGAVLVLVVLLVLKIRLGLELFRKTDVGVVGGGVYVVLNQEKNTILLPGNITWEGLPRGEPETVMIEEGVIRPWAWTKAFSPNVYIVRFSSGCVSVYNLRRFSGGYYQHDEPNRVAGEVSLPGPHTTRRTGPYRAVPEGHE